jgi:hypothetical protein
MRKMLGLIAILMCTVLYVTPAKADNQLVVNGGFETGDFTGWTLSGNTANPGIDYGVDGFDANSGAFGAYLGAIGSPITLSQTLSTTAGDNLVVSFAVAQNLDLANPVGSTNTFLVSLGGATLLSLSNPAAFGSYNVYTLDLTAASSSLVLNITSQNNSDFWSLDDVSVTAPEPVTLMLIGPGLAGLALLRRRS